MRDTVRETRAALGVAVAIGAAVGYGAGVAVSLPSGFWAWAGLVWSFVGAASLGLGFIAAEIAAGRFTSADTREPRRVGAAPICTSAIFGGVTAALLLKETASVTAVGTATFFALASAVATFSAGRRRTHATPDI